MLVGKYGWKIIVFYVEMNRLVIFFVNWELMVLLFDIKDKGMEYLECMFFVYVKVFYYFEDMF